MNAGENDKATAMVGRLIRARGEVLDSRHEIEKGNGGV